MTRDDAFVTFKKAAVDVLAVQDEQVTIEASFADDLEDRKSVV